MAPGEVLKTSGFMADYIPEQHPAYSCNIPVLGGLAGLQVMPDWSKAGHQQLLLATSLLYWMLEAPQADASPAPFRHLATSTYLNCSPYLQVLDDGSRVPVRLGLLALYVCEHVFEPKSQAGC